MPDVRRQRSSQRLLGPDALDQSQPSRLTTQVDEGKRLTISRTNPVQRESSLRPMQPWRAVSWCRGAREIPSEIDRRSA